MSRRLALLFITVLVLSSLVMVRSISAQSIPKPSVPEFTVEYTDNSYDVPPTYGVDQYTGEKVVTEYGYHVDNRTIEFTITSQPFTPYEDANGNNITLYYYFRYKGPYGDDWSYYPDSSHTYGYYVGLFPDTSASNSEYTIIGVNLPTLEIPIDSEVEFQVQAIMGYVEKGQSISRFAGGYMGFTGERSDWSNTQTLEIGEIQTPTPSPAATLTPTLSPTISPSPLPNPYEIPIAGVAFIVIVFAAGLGLLIYLIKRK
jgi:hypothetical protein